MAGLSAVYGRPQCTCLYYFIRNMDRNKYKKTFSKNVKRCRDGSTKKHSNKVHT